MKKIPWMCERLCDPWHVVTIPVQRPELEEIHQVVWGLIGLDWTGKDNISTPGTVN